VDVLDDVINDAVDNNEGIANLGPLTKLKADRVDYKDFIEKVIDVDCAEDIVESRVRLIKNSNEEKWIFSS
jgi:hypothetical protein